MSCCRSKTFYCVAPSPYVHMHRFGTGLVSIDCLRRDSQLLNACIVLKLVLLSQVGEREVGQRPRIDVDDLEGEVRECTYGQFHQM
eukprot:2190464-Pleurochrysis_carterae.AAC.1